MSTEECKAKMIAEDTITWNTLIADAEAEIRSSRDKLDSLYKSLNFFKNKLKDGAPFPHPEDFSLSNRSKIT